MFFLYELIIITVYSYVIIRGRNVGDRFIVHVVLRNTSHVTRLVKSAVHGRHGMNGRREGVNGEGPTLLTAIAFKR